MEDLEIQRYSTLFPFELKLLDEGLNCLGFNLKPNHYKMENWNWMPKKIEKRIDVWCHRWLSKAERLVLIKLVMEAIPVYWISLAWIPKSILNKAKKICFKFLWTGRSENAVTPWIKWD